MKSILKACNINKTINNKKILTNVNISINEGEIVSVVGPSGAGKTTLIKSICYKLGVKDVVKSPTFSIVNEYISEQNGKDFHFDFYRLKDEQEAFDMGCEDYFFSDAYCLVEWPEKVESLMPSSFKKLQIQVENGERIIKIKTNE